jgi:hypothetical protein
LTCLKTLIILWGKGHNYKNQNVKKKKVDQKFEKDQNVESLFKIDQNVKSFGSFPTQNLFDALILLMGLRMIRMLKV